MPETVEVPANMVMIRHMREGTCYLLKGNVMDLVADTAGLKSAAFVNTIFNIPNAASEMVRSIEALHTFFVAELIDQVPVLLENDKRDDLVVLRHSIKQYTLESYVRGDNTGMRAHILYAFLGFLLGNAAAASFRSLLDRYWNDAVSAKNI